MASRNHHNHEIPHSRPWVGVAETAALRRVINSGMLAYGAETEELERLLSALSGHAHGIAVASGTTALYLTLRGLKIGPGDRVIIPSYVCTALLNAVNAVGATAVLCDIDPETATITVDNIKAVARRRSAAVIVPHLFGIPAPIREITCLGIPVIEDCAQCVGATRNGINVGGAGVATIFSFYATKLIAAGEGGLIACSDHQLARHLRNDREYDNRNTYAPGFNHKISELQAAVAHVQTTRLASNIKHRRAIARGYQEVLLDGTGQIRPLQIEPEAVPIFYRFVVKTRRSPEDLIHAADKAGIALRRPIHKPLHEYLKQSGFAGTRELFRRALSIPIYPGLSPVELQRIIHFLKDRA